MSEAETILRYSRASILADYARAGIGVLLTGAPLLAVEANITVIVILGGLATLFALFGIKTYFRQRSIVRLDNRGVALIGPLGLRIDWAQLSLYKLAYYATRRDRQSGWMQLTLGQGKRRLKIDSTLDQFARLVEQAGLAAIARRVELSVATRANLAALNIVLPEAEA